MKKKYLKVNKLILNKSIISNLKSSTINGGNRTESCLDVGFGNCGTSVVVDCNPTDFQCQSNPCTAGCPPPPTDTCTQFYTQCGAQGLCE